MAQTPSSPYVEIVEQPSSKSRFRYECEGHNVGCLKGRSWSNGNKTYPSIKVQNYTGPCVAVVSLVTMGDKAKPHPHALVGDDCKQDVCTKKTKNCQDAIQFPKLGIQFKKRKDIIRSLQLRQQIKVDPFKTGFDHKEESALKKIDLTVVRLCFQVFLPDSTGKYQRALKPVCSEPIYNKKSVTELMISSFLPPSCTVNGGEPMILLTGKLPKDEIEVRFYEGPSAQPHWEAFGSFGPKDIHKQVALRITIPRYTKPLNSKQRVQVHIVLRCKTDPNECSEPVPFLYLVEGQLNMGRPRKRAQALLENTDQKKPRLEAEDSSAEQSDVPAVVNLFSASSYGSSVSSENISGLTSVEQISPAVHSDAPYTNNVPNQSKTAYDPPLNNGYLPMVVNGDGQPMVVYGPANLNHYDAITPAVHSDAPYTNNVPNQTQTAYAPPLNNGYIPMVINDDRQPMVVCGPAHLNHYDAQTDLSDIPDDEMDLLLQQLGTSSDLPCTVSGIFNSSGSLICESANGAVENQSTSLTRELRSLSQMDTGLS